MGVSEEVAAGVSADVPDEVNVGVCEVLAE